MRHNIYKSQNRKSPQRRLQNDTFRRSLVDDGILVLTTRGIYISSNFGGELSEFCEVGVWT